jgi:hypothetical protein
MNAAATAKAAAMEATTTPMEGAAAVKAAPAAAVTAPAAPSVLCERRTGASHGQGRQCTNYEPTQFPGCHDSSPSFL